MYVCHTISISACVFSSICQSLPIYYLSNQIESHPNEPDLFQSNLI